MGDKEIILNGCAHTDFTEQALEDLLFEMEAARRANELAVSMQQEGPLQMLKEKIVDSVDMAGFAATGCILRKVSRKDPNAD